MPQPKNEILVPLDESDFLAHCERQEQEIRKLKDALAEQEEALVCGYERQIAELKAEMVKHKAFWNNSRLVDQMKFEEYDWPRILKEGEER